MRRIIVCSLMMLCLFSFSAHADDGTVQFYQAPKQIVISFAGDCTLGNTPLERGRSSSFEAYIEKNGMEYPFAKVRDVFLQDDLTVVNLEGVFFDSEEHRVKKTYNFRGPTSFAAILPLGGIDAVSIGNNHAQDYGTPGQDATIAALEENGVAWFGTDSHVNRTYIFEKDGVKIGFVSAYISFWRSPGNPGIIKKCFDDLKAAGCHVLVGCIHGGVEYDVYHDDHQEWMADYFVSYGADIIIGHHPHTIQGLQVRDGRTMLYSLGNFCFGGNSKIRANRVKESTIRTFIAQFTFSFDENNTYLGHQLNIIPCHTSGTQEYNDYQPRLVTGNDAKAVLKAVQRDVMPRSFKLNPYVEGVGAVQDFVPAPKK